MNSKPHTGSEMHMVNILHRLFGYGATAEELVSQFYIDWKKPTLLTYDKNCHNVTLHNF